MFSDLPFDDMSLPIKFDIADNDAKFEIVLGTDSNNVNDEWVWDLADFYGPEFDVIDIFVITGQDKKTDVFGPLIVDQNLADDDYIVVDNDPTSLDALDTFTMDDFRDEE